MAGRPIGSGKIGNRKTFSFYLDEELIGEARALRGKLEPIIEAALRAEVESFKDVEKTESALIAAKQNVIEKQENLIKEKDEAVKHVAALEAQLEKIKTFQAYKTGLVGPRAAEHRQIVVQAISRTLETNFPEAEDIARKGMIALKTRYQVDVDVMTLMEEGRRLKESDAGKAYR